MKSLKKYFIWYYMLSKRLLKKKSFIILLCIIPIIIPLVNMAMSQDSGILKIVLCNDGNTDTSAKIIDSLINDDGVILYSVADSRRSATKDVISGKADAAWIFSPDIDEGIENYNTDNINQPLIDIIQREDSIQLKLSKELLYSALFETLSRSLYKNFVYANIVSEDILSSEEIDRYYDNMDKPDNIIQLERLDSGPVKTQSNYLSVPLRGLLSLFVVFATLAAVMYFLKDQSENKYSWMPVKKRLAPAFASCLSASCFSAIAVFIALNFSNISVGFMRELISMILFVIASTAFGLLLCIIFKSYGKLGASIPGMIIIMLILSPIFFDVRFLKPIKMMLPTYYYLYSISDSTYLLYMVLYSIIMFMVCILLNQLLSNKKISS